MRKVLTVRYLSLMPAFLALILCGCATVIYRPTQADKMPYTVAVKKILGQKGNKLMVRPNFYTIADVKLSSSSMDFTYFKHAAFGKDSADTAKFSVPIASLGDLSVLEKAAQYSVMSGEQALLVLGSREGACATADALLALKSRAAGSRPAKNQAAEATFQEEARKYRELALKPALPEEARKHSVQGDFALEMKKGAAAEQSYKEALALAPWWPEGHFKRGVILASLERYEEAIDEMKRFLLLAPDGKQAREAQDNIYKWESVAALLTSGAAPSSETVPAQPGAVPDGAPIFTGRVESIDGIILPRAGGGRGARVKMNVISDSGERSLCIVLSDATIRDVDGADITARQLKGKRVEMRYIEDTILGWFRVPQTVMAATAIRVLEP